MRWLLLVAVLSGLCIPRNKNEPPSPLGCMLPVPGFGQEVPHRNEQEGPELAFYGIYRLQNFIFQDVHKKILRQVLRCVWIVAAPPDKGIKGIPVDAAEIGQCFLRGLRAALGARRQHGAPVRGGKLRRAVHERAGRFWASVSHEAAEEA